MNNFLDVVGGSLAGGHFQQPFARTGGRIRRVTAADVHNLFGVGVAAVGNVSIESVQPRNFGSFENDAGGFARKHGVVEANAGTHQNGGLEGLDTGRTLRMNGGGSIDPIAGLAGSMPGRFAAHSFENGEAELLGAQSVVDGSRYQFVGLVGSQFANACDACPFVAACRVELLGGCVGAGSAVGSRGHLGQLGGNACLFGCSCPLGFAHVIANDDGGIVIGRRVLDLGIDRRGTAGAWFVARLVFRAPVAARAAVLCGHSLTCGNRPGIG